LATLPFFHPVRCGDELQAYRKKLLQWLDE
jgi:hypothetical protein